MKTTFLNQGVGKIILLASIFLTLGYVKPAMAQEPLFTYDNRTFFEVDGRLGK